MLNHQESQTVAESASIPDNTTVAQNNTDKLQDSNSPTFSSSADLKTRLIDGLKKIPESWALTPIKEDKQAYLKGWSKNHAVGIN
ncbi:MAG: hypothetical protein HC907_14915 [Richelia sp. SM1_7_0]|nr:hypothetical protein [Richelia sp. SM1_7_0]